MKKIVITALFGALPWFASAADINVNLGSVRVDAPGVSVTFGTRNDRGYYWDGYDWRDPGYWRSHNGPRGERYYTGRGNNGVPMFTAMTMSAPIRRTTSTGRLSTSPPSTSNRPPMSTGANTAGTLIDARMTAASSP